jgi:hypothetical protein
MILKRYNLRAKMLWGFVFSQISSGGLIAIPA